ncbi:MAG: hypothetical protein R6U32_01090 [Candidatus Woesearchaeota archaeon]
MDSEPYRKEGVWEEINNLVHIGRSADDIRQTLSKMGYDQSTLNDILTSSFMDGLMQKEQGFVEIQRSANKRTAQQEKKEENEALKQKDWERQAQKQRIQEDFLVQHEEQTKYAKDESERADFEHYQSSRG